MRVRSVCVTPKDACLLGLIVVSIPGDPTAGRSMVARRQIALIAIDVATVLSIVLIMDTLVEAGHCTAQIVGCIKGRATVGLIKAPACGVSEDGSLEATSAGFARSIGEWLKDISLISTLRI
jgi:hypothetical protein